MVASRLSCICFGLSSGVFVAINRRPKTCASKFTSTAAFDKYVSHTLRWEEASFGISGGSSSWLRPWTLVGTWKCVLPLPMVCCCIRSGESTARARVAVAGACRKCCRSKLPCRESWTTTVATTPTSMLPTATAISLFLEYPTGGA